MAKDLTAAGQGLHAPELRIAQLRALATQGARDQMTHRHELIALLIRRHKGNASAIAQGLDLKNAGQLGGEG